MKEIIMSSMLIVASCGTQEPIENNSNYEIKSTAGAVRFVCADDVLTRNRNFEVVDSIDLKFGDKVVLTGARKNRIIDGETIDYREFKDSRSGEKALVAARFLKTQTCAPHVGSGSLPADSVLSFAMEPGLAAMLDTIAYAEFYGNEDYYTTKLAYSTLFGYLKFQSFNRHPGTSRAAGRYQIKTDTWGDIQRWLHHPEIGEISSYVTKNDLRDFTPKSQDKAAIVLIWYKEQFLDLRDLSLNDNDRLYAITTRLAETWASLPNAPYGQPTVKWNEFKRVFWDNYKKYQ